MARAKIQAYPSPKMVRIIKAYAKDEERSEGSVACEMFAFFFASHPELKRRCESLSEKAKTE